MTGNREQWKVFYNRITGKEYTSYTIRGTFEGEEEATAQQLADEHGIDRADILTRIETRPANFSKSNNCQ